MPLRAQGVEGGVIPGNARADHHRVETSVPGTEAFRLQWQPKRHLDSLLTQRCSPDFILRRLSSLDHRDGGAVVMQQTRRTDAGASKPDHDRAIHQKRFPDWGVGDTGFEPVTPTMSM